jgi:beta-glucanase (GH16 family)
MKHVALSLATLLLISGCTVSSSSVVSSSSSVVCKTVGFDYNPAEIDDYEMVWNEEFDYEGSPDTTKWVMETGGGGWGNNELQFYTARQDNAIVGDGKLTITAIKEDYSGRNYTSARMITRGKAFWKYGRFEIRASLPAGRGTWPAIWMMPQYSRYGGWPKSGEIDIMEHVGYDMNKIVSTVHTEDYVHSKGTQKGASRTIEDATQMHVYSMDWTPSQMTMYVDGLKIFQYKPTNYRSCPNQKIWPFDQSFFLILNIAVGGNWGGVQGVDDSIFPQELNVDYIRIYQSPTITNLVQNT